MYLVIITADYNDADYVREVHEMSNKEIAEFIKAVELVKTSKNYNPNNFEWFTGDLASASNYPTELYGDVASEEVIEYLIDLVPYHEYGVHSIESIVIYSCPAAKMFKTEI